MTLDDLAHELAGADRHRRLVHDDGVALHRLADRARDLADGGEVGLAIALGRRADGDEDDDGAADRVGEIGRERQAGIRHVARDHLFQARLVDRHAAGTQLGDLVVLVVHTDDLVAEVGEDGARDEADVAGSDDADVHDEPATIIAGVRRPTGKTASALENLLDVGPGRERGERVRLRPQTDRRRRRRWYRDRRSGCGHPARRRSANRTAGLRSRSCCSRHAPSRSTRARCARRA